MARRKSGRLGPVHIRLDALNDTVAQVTLIFLIYQAPAFPAVTDEARFDQNGRHLSAQQHIKRRLLSPDRFPGRCDERIRGQRKKADADDDIENIIDTGLSNKAFRKSWARLIQKVYEVDPLLCPKCQGEMKIISFIEEQVVIRQILQYLGLWEVRNTGPPSESHLNIVRELTYQPVPDQGPPDLSACDAQAGDGFWSQVPNYGYWAE